MTSLAHIYREQGRQKEPEKLHLQVKKLRDRMLEEHRDILSSTASLGLISTDKDQQTEAEELQVKVMKTRNRVFEEEHSDTLSSQKKIWPLCTGIKVHLTRAEELQCQVVKTQEKKNVRRNATENSLKIRTSLAGRYILEPRSLRRSCRIIEKHCCVPVRSCLNKVIPDTTRLDELLRKNLGYMVTEGEHIFRAFFSYHCYRCCEGSCSFSLK